MSTEFAVELPADDHAAALEILAAVKEWKRPKGRDYFIALLGPADHPLLEGCKRAFLVKIEPGGNLHAHKDLAAETFDADMIVVATNERCLNFWRDAEGEHSVHLELGKRYELLKRTELHWSTNEGATDRVNLVIEYPRF